MACPGLAWVTLAVFLIDSVVSSSFTGTAALDTLSSFTPLSFGLVTDAVLMIVPVVIGSTSTCTATVWPLSTVPRLQVIVSVTCEQVPCVVVIPISFTVLGSASVTTVFGESAGPLLVTLIVYPSARPYVAGPSAVFTIFRSEVFGGSGAICVGAVLVLLVVTGSGSVAETGAVLLIELFASDSGTFTVIKICVAAPTVRSPTAQLTVPLACVQVPCAGFAST